MKNLEMSLKYPAKITPDGDGYIVNFRDLENVFTEGDTYEEALFNAQEALDMLLLEMAKDAIHIKNPSPCESDEILVTVSPEVAVPVLLYKLRMTRQYTLADMARLTGMSYQNYQQIEAGKNITLKSLKKAASALGAIVEFKLHAVKDRDA